MDGQIFADPVGFIGTHFSNSTSFKGTYFGKFARFDKTHFADIALFNKAHFTIFASFRRTYFARIAHFNGAHFPILANFNGTHFALWAEFISAHFGDRTDFSKARFEFSVPSFHGVEKLYSDTRFDFDDAKWPDPANKPDNQENEYNYLRYLTNKALLHDAERFFEKQILRVKEAQDWQGITWRKYKTWRMFLRPKAWLRLPSAFASMLYGVFSNYGQSWVRPLGFLIYIIGLFAWVLTPVANWSISKAVEMSASNALGFLGFKRLVFKEDVYEGLSFAAKFTLGLEAIFALFLLFLFGLGLRSRFRVK